MQAILLYVLGEVKRPRLKVGAKFPVGAVEKESKEDTKYKAAEEGAVGWWCWDFEMCGGRGEVWKW